MTTPSLSEQIAAAARDLQGQDEQHTMDDGVRLAVQIIDGAERATVSLIRRRHSLETLAATDDVVRGIDALQVECQEGPCIEAIHDHELIYSPNLATEHRWPTWAAKAAEQYDVRSMLCFRLFTDRDTVGGLNLYSTRVDGFDGDDQENGLALAAHLAIAMSGAQQLTGLQVAMETRNLIGQAQGILMERLGIDAETAFQVLVRVSSHSNHKLRDVAEELITSRRTPGT